MSKVNKIGFAIMMSALFILTSCSEQPDGDWYDQTVEHNQQRDNYIEDMVDAGMTAKEAREMHDRRVWEMNTINMAREGEKRE
jgi:hypothetical protein